MNDTEKILEKWRSRGKNAPKDPNVKPDAVLVREGPRPQGAVGPRFATAIACAVDKSLYPATRVYFFALAWRYQPGRVFRGEIRPPEIGLSERSCRRARQELRAAGYLIQVKQGLIIPAVENTLEDNVRVHWRFPQQLSLAFQDPIQHAPPSIRRYLTGTD